MNSTAETKVNGRELFVSEFLILFHFESYSVLLWKLNQPPRALPLFAVEFAARGNLERNAEEIHISEGMTKKFPSVQSDGWKAVNERWSEPFEAITGKFSQTSQPPALSRDRTI